ncbi:MAG TPA: NPCBM/NEW2 domain-containing protein [Pirellulales bacterium]|nr:NPCBM/NEW2 domain-containing protein [Pirellulales bacterium]
MSRRSRIAAVEFGRLLAELRRSAGAVGRLTMAICLAAIGMAPIGCQRAPEAAAETRANSTPNAAVKGGGDKPAEDGTPTAEDPAPEVDINSAPIRPPTRVWLSDLEETNVSVGAGKFGKHGLAGCAPGVVRINGISSHHGLGMHADAHVEYSLGKKYRMFRTSVALNDSAGGNSGRPVQFRVLGDGKTLWKSCLCYRGGSTGQPCLLDVSGVDVLRLEVQFVPNTTGIEETAHAAWVEPYVSDEVPSAEALHLCSPERFDAQAQGFTAEATIRELFAAEKFADLDEMAKQLRKHDISYGGMSLLGSLYESLSNSVDSSDEGWQKHFDRLERWRTAQPASITPLIVLGSAYTDYAWRARGHDYAKNVPEDAWPKFKERLKKARAYFEQAQALDRDPHLYCCLISMALSQGIALDEVMPLVEEGRRLFPRYYDLYDAAATCFLPQWFGKKGDVEKFAARMRQELGGELGDEVYFRIAAGQLPYLIENFFRESGFKYSDLVPGIKVALRDYPESDFFYNAACCMACLSGDSEMSRLLLLRMDPATFSWRPWGTYARMVSQRAQINRDATSDEANGMFYPDTWMGNIAFLGTSDRLITSGADPHLDVANLRRGIDAQIPVKPNVGGLAADKEGKTVIIRWIAEPPAASHEAEVYTIGSNDPPVVLTGHTANVAGVAMSGDGKRCATTALDGTARIWSLADPEKPIVLKHPREVFAVAFAPDGKTVATTNDHGVIWLWDAETGQRAAEPLGEDDKDHGQCRIRFLPDGKEIISVAHDGTIRRWNLAERKYREAELGGDLVSQIGLSADGKWLAVGREGGSIDLVAADTFKIVHTWYGHFQLVGGLAFSPDGKTLASSSHDGGLKIWPLEKLVSQ